jgi:hypothetical protein
MRAAQNLLRLLPKRPVVAPRTRAVIPTRGGGHVDPNAPAWEKAVRSVLVKDEHVVFAVMGIWAVAIFAGNKALSKPKAEAAA